MRDYIDAPTQAAIASRTAIAPVHFVWIEARNRTTGGQETMGLWTGWDTVDVPVLNPDTLIPVTRTYHAGGSVLDVPEIPHESDLTIQTIRIRLSQINEAVQIAIRGYDPQHAPVQVHLGFLDPDTQLLVAPPVPIFIGWINGAPIRTPAAGSEGGIEIACVSDVRLLTKTVPLLASDEAYRKRTVGGVEDRIMKYADVAGGWLANMHWGESKS